MYLWNLVNTCRLSSQNIYLMRWKKVGTSNFALDKGKRLKCFLDFSEIVKFAGSEI